MNKIHQIIADKLSILKFEFMKDEIERSFEDDKNLKILFFQWKQPQIMLLKLIWYKKY